MNTTIDERDATSISLYPARDVYWGHWGITFIKNGKIIFHYSFPVSDSGPCSGSLGSPLMQRHQNMVTAWLRGQNREAVESIPLER